MCVYVSGGAYLERVAGGEDSLRLCSCMYVCVYEIILLGCNLMCCFFHKYVRMLVCIPTDMYVCLYVYLRILVYRMT
jgi:hypothetical protein